MSTAVPTKPDIDLAEGEFYAGDSHSAYRWMRANEPVFRDRNGLLGAATFRAVIEAERAPDLFSNAGGIRPDYVPPVPQMIDMDDPGHLRRRKLVNAGFTRKRVKDVHLSIRQMCDALIDSVCERGECDFVRDLAAPLPMAIIGDMLGVQPAQRAMFLKWSDDLISVLTHAVIDGERLTDDEIVQDSLLILVGGDETTRHTISGGVRQLLRQPEQLHSLRSDPDRLLPTAVEEMLRWTSPIKNMCRILTADTEFHGTEIRAGEKIMLLFESANFDEQQFDDPETFDIERHPNSHLAFGFGTHFCMGNQLARLEISSMTRRVLERLPDLQLASDDALPLRPANFVSGLEAMPVVFTPTKPLGQG